MTLDVVKDEDFARKEYLKEMRHEARMQFWIRSRMMNCKMKFQNDFKNCGDVRAVCQMWIHNPIFYGVHHMSI